MLANMKVGKRLSLGFGLVMLFLVIIAIYGAISAARLNVMVDKLARDRYPKIIRLFEVKESINLVARGMRNIALAKDPETARKEMERIKGADESMTKNLDALEKVFKSEEGKKLLREVVEGRARYVDGRKRVFEMFDQGKFDEVGKYLIVDFRKLQNGYFDAINAVIKFQDKDVERLAKDCEEDTAFVRNAMIVLGIIALILGCLIAIGITRSITAPVTYLSGQVRKVADGNLAVEVVSHSGDEIGELAESFSTMVANLRNLIGKMAESSSLVASASHQLIATSGQISEGAADVASQAGTVATAAEEMSATSGDIAQNCQMAAEGSHRASRAASAGAEVVNGTVQVMGRIAGRVQETAKTVESLGARSDQIGEIIGTIQDIADQTNLLALNAAIEAARAGEQGRGFAVVADEVRALAERTTRATREIGDMIKAIQSETKSAVSAMEEGVREVELGTDEAAKSGRALEDILEQINSVTMQINQVATAAEEQTATTSEISGNIQNINDIMQSTVRGAQESASAASRLSLQSEEMQRLVGQFKL